MARAELRLILVGLTATSLLIGCVEGGGAAGDGTSALASPARAKSGGAREVEAPDVYQVTESALWDGRPSLGGIWVAAFDVTSPERVVMFNPATGKSVNGALFKRERDNPGPKLQISSDAAEALGILAGQPTELRVTALRKEEVEAPPEAISVPEAATDTAVPEATAPDSAAAETAALATAALDAADGGDAAAETAATETVAAPEPPKKTWKERRAEAKAKREAEKAAKAAAAAAPEGEAPAEGATPVDPAASAVATIETAPLDARSAEATPAPAPEKKKTRSQIRAEEAAAAAAATPEVATPAPTGGRAIQVASFSKEENAKRAVEALSKIGIAAQPQKSERGGKAVWGVVAMGDADLLAKIKAAGFADAYFLQ